MSLQSFKKMLDELRGEYVFDFANDDDSAHFFEEFGGEERLKARYPTVYESYLNARGNSLRKRLENSAPGEHEAAVFTGNVEKLSFENMDKNDGAGDGFGRLVATVNCGFLDYLKKVNDNSAASPWTGVSIQTVIQECHSPGNY